MGAALKAAMPGALVPLKPFLLNLLPLASCVPPTHPRPSHMARVGATNGGGCGHNFSSYGRGPTLAQKVRAVIWQQGGRWFDPTPGHQKKKVKVKVRVKVLKGLGFRWARILQFQEVLQAQVCRDLEHGSKASPLRCTDEAMEEDVEAFLEVFEHATTGEKWPQDNWGWIIAIFLTQEAQPVYRDLALGVAAVLARYGLSLPAWAQWYGMGIHSGRTRPGE